MKHKLTFALALILALALPAFAADETLQWDNRTQSVSGCVTNNAAMEVRNLRCDASTNRLEVEVEAAALPTGAATEASLAAAVVDLAALEVDLAAIEILQTAIEANTSVAPTAATVGAGAAAQAADFAVLGAVANQRLTKLTILDNGAGTAAGVIRHAAMGADCNTGNVIAYFGVLGAAATYDLVVGSRDLDVASGVCVDVTAGTVSAAWASVVEAGP